MKYLALLTAFLLLSSSAPAQPIADVTSIHRCIVKGFFPGMTEHQRVRLLGERYGDPKARRSPCYRTIEEFQRDFNVSPGQAKSLYGAQCMERLPKVVLDKSELARVFPPLPDDPGEFSRTLDFVFGTFFQYDEEAKAYFYENARDGCAMFIDKDFRLTLIPGKAPPKPPGKPGAQ